MSYTRHTFLAGIRKVMFACTALIAVVGTIAYTFQPAQVSAVCGGGCVASMSASPGSGTYNPGNTVTVSVYVNSGGQTVNAVQADFTYTASRLEFQSINTAGSAFDVTAPSSGGSGSVSIARGSISGTSGASLLVAQVNFKVLSDAGTASISFSNSSEVYNTSNTDILGGKTGASYIVAIPAAPAPTQPAPTTSPTYTQPGPTPSSGTNKKPVAAAPAQPTDSTQQPAPEAPTTTTEQPKTNKTSTPVTTSTTKNNSWLPIALVIGGVVVAAGGAGAWLFIRRRRMGNPVSASDGTVPTSTFITGGGVSMPPVQPPASTPQDGFTSTEHHDDTHGPSTSN